MIRSVGAFVDEAAARYGDRQALVFDDRRWTFAGFRDDVDRTARALLALGVAPGDRVAVWMPNRPEWLHVFYALAKIGGVLVPLNTRFRGAEAAYVLGHSGATVLVTVSRFGPHHYAEMVRAMAPSFGDLHVVTLGDDVPAGAVSWTDMLAAGATVPPHTLASRQAAIDGRQPLIVMYTSGTTGVPKGAVHSHAVAQTVVDSASRLGITPRDVLLVHLPLFHSMGLYEGGLMFLVSGACGIVMERFDAGDALGLVERERVTYLAGFDTHFQDMLDHPSCAATDHSSLRLGFLPAGLASTEHIARRVNRELCRTVSAYGSTEVGTGACLSFVDATEDERCTGSGFPLPGYEVKTVDPASGQRTGPGVPGEICMRGYGVTPGYYGKPGETAAAFDTAGWFHTGDMGVLDDAGFLRLIGRYKDMLKVGGENVDPLEVEAYLLGHPAVRHVKVVGVPDRRLGEVVAVCVVARPGHTVTTDEVVTFCRGRMAGFKVPRHVLFVSSYPMTASGKVQRRALRAQVLTALAVPPKDAVDDGDREHGGADER